MNEVSNIKSLREIVGSINDTYYVKGHTNPGDGGGGIFIWRNYSEFLTAKNGIYSIDNNGTIIQAVTNGVKNDTGRWVRQYEGFINVLYFGAFGVGNDYNTEIQNAIDFAKINTSDVSLLKNSTVYIPNGSYVLEKITLKSGVNIIGESISSTIIYTKGEGKDGDYLFDIEDGIVEINISNLNILGYEPLTDTFSNKGCFHIKAKPNTDVNDPIKHGGLWNSTFKNILIRRFYGNGIYIEGGIEDSNYNSSLLPNQFNIFENVKVFKHNDLILSKFSNSLKMTGQNGQHTFLNCQFDGHKFYDIDRQTVYYDKNPNISIENINNDYLTSNVVTFLNCTIQDSDYGVSINYAENITFDNCWFENLGISISVLGDKERSKSINVLNSRFANASGFGSLYTPFNIKDNTACVVVKDSVVNIYNNYVTVSNTENIHNSIGKESMFVIGLLDNNDINCYNNTFRDDNLRLSRTTGIVKNVEVYNNTIDCKSSKFISLRVEKGKCISIRCIESVINTGETLTIIIDGKVNIYESDSIILNKRSISLSNGDIIAFIKTDIGYKLLLLTKKSNSIFSWLKNIL